MANNNAEQTAGSSSTALVRTTDEAPTTTATHATGTPAEQTVTTITCAVYS
ncbi:hypothetical protein PC129_g20724 [Phytophthora cactorum]|uniref:Uncharacterized protein n=1 Tax=Phytophthora cactorum TaxID=29920 RepID=A0A8T0YAH3_9STRA|nr:hypothetical protein Pcac1_g17827 [Phytophthora cactorum]KAG2798022.1 hypothetical protein PC112_g21532 [Phytophthora cactorum]KAG2828627.1 hypothetical protein PC113_g21429 [Phytophthora cactorum]KAG2877077.1 hypothetical protein PC114_g23843 [Phytophthora cactorum]KAG2884769.1 hypothetical protein PC115_g21235 [Phytophthora cactorum]